MTTEKTHSDSWKWKCKGKLSLLQEKLKDCYCYDRAVRTFPYVVLAVCAVVGGRIWYYHLSYSGKYTEFDELLKAAIESSPCVNSILTIGLFFAMLLLFVHVCFLHSKWWHLPAYAITATYILVIPQWVAVNTIIPCINYPWLIAILLKATFICELGVLVLNHCTKKELAELPDCQNGFLVKMADSEMESTNWEEFIKNIFRMIGEKQLAKESFAIGIAGSWGSGKTTFYDQVKKYLDASGQFEICEFKPWQILEPSRIAPEFFNEFAKAVNRKGEEWKPELNKTLAKYAQILAEIPKISVWAKFITLCFNPSPKTTLEELRQEVDTLMEKQQTYVAVMIDDLDRLKQEELIEIMRLVRASANFRHVLFILVYDKEHFVKELGGDKDKVEYLKKIVNVEFNLPLIENYKYRDLMIKNIMKIVPNLQDAQIKELDKACRVKNSANDNILLTIYSHNFRDILRFSNHFGLVLRHLQEQEILDKFSLRDLFWLEILYYYEEDMYKQLQSPLWTILKTVEDPLTKQQYLTLRDSKNHHANNNLLGYDILKELFDPAKRNNANSIVWRNNFNNYFAHRLLDNAVSMFEFANWVEFPRYSRDTRARVKDWHDHHARISLLNVIRNYPHNNVFKSEVAFLNYIRVLFILKYKHDAFTIEEFSSILHIKCRSSYLQNTSTDRLKILLKKHIFRRPVFAWNYVLAAMCPVIQEDLGTDRNMRRNHKKTGYLLNRHNLAELAKLNYTLLFKEHDMPFGDLFKSSSQYMGFLSATAFLEKIDSQGEKHYNNLLGDYIIERLESTLKERLGDNEFHKMYIRLSDFAAVNREEDEDNVIYKKITDSIERILGSKRNIERLIDKHFVLGENSMKICAYIGLDFKSTKIENERNN